MWFTSEVETVTVCQLKIAKAKIIWNECSVEAVDGQVSAQLKVGTVRWTHQVPDSITPVVVRY